ncbi:LuxR family transcriptional regulator [Nocardioides psychrotolerans]|uniref:LuxR family transcriptional regulator, maltose regulon positive regulatory protein n=1 Tax=Nocardioides psychrotolerans TaxID=1005945 RepID=A0A1I3ESN1_9ACTN|nr:LuxR C-terminal-related transcriptional regulator [Nocardioides psychrotolerans]GEP39178.1 LuxR family transcriptional regulator [Nocardioides psychrotolerans]SFI01651.1 LuxR family transcriptional regulator, maltose regulon positive regulatory protein [Nocardioides psychrotolerans]
MVDPVVETKLLLPRPRRDVVPRPRLAELLLRGSQGPVTLVSAPAGFGKTTLLASWFATAPAAHDDRLVAWVSLDERDREATSFWTYVLMALDRAVPGSGAGALTLLQSGQATVETVLAGVVNELSVHPGEVTVVLDDYHLADGVEVATGMAFLIDHLPPQLRLVLGTRADPALPLSRLRARGELVEIRASDLRFTREEVSSYLNDLNGLDLTTADLAALEAHTEGWVAALQLAALSLRDRDREDRTSFIAGFAGDDRFVVDYLVEEVLSRQPDGVRRFLLDTSILDRLTGSLCDAVSPLPERAGGQSGRAMLEALDRANLFLVPLDDHRSWYRYHHLFGDVLHAHLLDERPDDVSGLHRRAAGWYAEAGQTEAAVRHALAAGDTERAADLVELNFRALGRERREDLLRRWAHELPDDVVRDRPVLGIALIGGLMASNEVDGVDLRLDHVEQLLARSAADLVVADRDELSRVPATVNMYRAALALLGGDPAGAITRAQHAVEAAVAGGDDLVIGGSAALSGLASWTTGNIVSAHASYNTAITALTRAGHIADVLGCSIAMADMELRLGRLREADRTVARALELAAASTPTGSEVTRGTADMLVGLSRMAWCRNDLAAAADYLRRSDELGEAASLAQNPYRWRVGMARLRAAEGDLSTALELLDEAERLYVGDFSPNVQPVHATRARVLAAHGDIAEARAWARHHQVTPDDELSYMREYEHITLARILLAEHAATGTSQSLHDAARLLDRLLAAAQNGERIGSVIELEVLRAVALAGGARDEALEALGHAVELAQTEGWVRIFVDAAPALTDLLAELAPSQPPSGYLWELLTAVTATGSAATEAADEVGPGPAPGSRRGLGLVDPLSERELDVLRLLGSDLDGPAIARTLFVSLNTVRTHTKHIYTKLGVNSRRAAISKAHQLGLLSGSGNR